ncbi:anticodon-binding protein, partial [Paraphysoderma sedebokerense]
DPELLNDESIDEFASYFVGGREPKICVTTSMRYFISIFPSAELRKRGTFSIKQISEFCVKRDYTTLIVINEDRKQPNAITMIHLPEGPTACFKLSSIKMCKEIEAHGNPTPHHPELILNNFSTRLGHTIGRFFATLFPPAPEFIARQVVTFHNQRDFIFVRRHRYIFDNREKVRMQELGPRFTLKLQWLQKGVFDGKHGEWEWVFRESEMGGRKKFWL